MVRDRAARSPGRQPRAGGARPSHRRRISARPNRGPGRSAGARRRASTTPHRARATHRLAPVRVQRQPDHSFRVVAGPRLVEPARRRPLEGSAAADGCDPGRVRGEGTPRRARHRRDHRVLERRGDVAHPHRGGAADARGFDRTHGRRVRTSIGSTRGGRPPGGVAVRIGDGPRGTDKARTVLPRSGLPRCSSSGHRQGCASGFRRQSDLRRARGSAARCPLRGDCRRPVDQGIAGERCGPVDSWRSGRGGGSGLDGAAAVRPRDVPARRNSFRARTCHRDSPGDCSRQGCGRSGGSPALPVALWRRGLFRVQLGPESAHQRVGFCRGPQGPQFPRERDVARRRDPLRARPEERARSLLGAEAGKLADTDQRVPDRARGGGDG